MHSCNSRRLGVVGAKYRVIAHLLSSLASPGIWSARRRHALLLLLLLNLLLLLLNLLLLLLLLLLLR